MPARMSALALRTSHEDYCSVVYARVVRTPLSAAVEVDLEFGPEFDRA
jgi:hypothetical protein